MHLSYGKNDNEPSWKELRIEIRWRELPLERLQVWTDPLGATTMVEVRLDWSVTIAKNLVTWRNNVLKWWDIYLIGEIEGQIEQIKEEEKGTQRCGTMEE